MKYDSYGEKELYDELFQVICEASNNQGSRRRIPVPACEIKIFEAGKQPFGICD